MAQQFSGAPYLNSYGVQDRYSYNGELPPDTAIGEQSLNRKQQIANLLLQQGLQGAGSGQMVGRFYVPTSGAQHASKLGEILAGALGTHAIDQQRNELSDTMNTQRAQAVTDYIQKTSPQPVTTELEGPGAPVPSATANDWVNQLTPGEVHDGRISQELAAGGPGMTQEGARPTTTTMQPASADSKRAALIQAMTSQIPGLRQFAHFQAQQDQAAQEHDTQRAFLSTEKAADRDVRREGIQSNALTRAEMIRGNMINTQAQIDARNQAGKDANDLKAELARQNADLQKTLHGMDIQGRKDVAGIVAESRTDVAGMKAGQKGQMPPAALKMQQEGLDAIGTASSLNADLKALDDQVSSGQLKLGMVDNLLGTAKNYVGMSDESSRKLSTFKATLEKQRNDSLRLNKGVQTEGDAVRAWNELIANINDPKLVSQRLKEIIEINARAANLRQLEVDTIRRNYGLDPLDTHEFRNQPAAVGAGSVAPAKIASDDDFNALPSGAMFIGPDGKTRKKP